MRKRQVTPSKQSTGTPITPQEDTHTSLDTIRELQEQLEEAKHQAAQIQKDFDEKHVTCTNLQDSNRQLQEHLLERDCQSKERDRHSKVLTKLVEARRELQIARYQLKNNTSTDITLRQQRIN
jgi:hypothetical protein